MRKLICLSAILVFVTAANADFFDNFESYTSTADLSTVWVGTLATLDTAFGNPGQSMFHPGGVRNDHMFDVPFVDTPGSPIVWEFDLYDNATGNKRLTSTLPDTTGGWLEFGMYNALVEPVSGATVDGYGMRIYGHGGEGWRSFPNDPATRTGWHHFKATLTADEIVFEVWLAEGLNAAGNPVAAEYSMYTSTLHDGTGLAWDRVRFGGPSNLSSAGGGAWLDNLNVHYVPEPAALAMLLIGSLTLLRRRQTLRNPAPNSRPANVAARVRRGEP